MSDRSNIQYRPEMIPSDGRVSADHASKESFTYRKVPCGKIVEVSGGATGFILGHEWEIKML